MESGAAVVVQGKSLPVPCVQELAKRHTSTVPSRYVRPPNDRPLVCTSGSCPPLPIIDMQRLIHGDAHVASLELDKLHFTCRDWGFFQRLKADIKEFFKLPLEKKKKFGQQTGDLEGYGQAFVLSEEQKLDWSDMFYMVVHPPRLRKPHIFENLPPTLRETLEVYVMELQKIAMTILEKMARALMKIEEMTEMFGDGYQGMRMNYYPPCPQPELVVAATPHSDGSGLTILLQVNETDGLQMKHQGKWIPVKPLPNAFIDNVGDMLEILSNGIYHSCEHRVAANSVQDRISVATFFNPKLKAEIGPANSLIEEGYPSLFKRMTVEEYFRGFFSHPITGRSYIDSFKDGYGKI